MARVAGTDGLDRTPIGRRRLKEGGRLDKAARMVPGTRQQRA